MRAQVHSAGCSNLAAIADMVADSYIADYKIAVVEDSVEAVQIHITEGLLNPSNCKCL